ncbi:YceD family protein [Arhodomonas sp. AD133]|uniref:YceD family protein n=1 Tax=Arhodomonas sp. AD133 TaxID=3415009 RepID=UPI003EB6D502
MANIPGLMRDETLPQWIDLDRVGDGGLQLAGTVPVSALARLGDLLKAASDPVTVEVRVVRDQTGAAVVIGHVDGQLPLECQRCLDVVVTAVHGEFELMVVASETEAAALGQEQDAAVAHEGRLDLYALVEDELILGLPVVARHAGEQGCEHQLRHFGPPGEPEPERENPFAKLAELKKRETDD